MKREEDIHEKVKNIADSVKDLRVVEFKDAYEAEDDGDIESHLDGTKNYLLFFLCKSLKNYKSYINVE